MSNTAKRTPEAYAAAMAMPEKKHRKKRIVDETFMFGVKFYPEAKRCPGCGTRNHKRDGQGYCQGCCMQRKR